LTFSFQAQLAGMGLQLQLKKYTYILVFQAQLAGMGLQQNSRCDFLGI